MKKFLIMCAILFIANVGCKKTNIGGGRLCGCSPVVGPQLNLVIRNSAGEDLLNDKTARAYSKDKIEFFMKDGNGKVVPISFGIRPPFSYSDGKFNFNTLFSDAIGVMQESTDKVIYLKLGSGGLHELKFTVNAHKLDMEKLLIDDKEPERAKSNAANFPLIFYLTE